MITDDNGSCAGGKGRGVQSMEETREDFCPNFLQPFLENVTTEAGRR